MATATVDEPISKGSSATGPPHTPTLTNSPDEPGSIAQAQASSTRTRSRTAASADASLTPVAPASSPGQACFECEEATASIFCADCNTHFCTGCSDAAHRLKINRSHHLMPLQERASFLSKRDGHKCEQHPHQTMYHFCSAHSVPCCGDCCVGSGTHARCAGIAPVKEAAAQARRELQHMLTAALTRADATSKATEGACSSAAKLDGYVTAVRASYSSAIKTLEQQFSLLADALDERREQLQALLDQQLHASQLAADELRHADSARQELVLALQDQLREAVSLDDYATLVRAGDSKQHLATSIQQLTTVTESLQRVPRLAPVQLNIDSRAVVAAIAVIGTTESAASHAPAAQAAVVQAKGTPPAASARAPPVSAAASPSAVSTKAAPLPSLTASASVSHSAPAAAPADPPGPPRATATASDRSQLNISAASGNSKSSSSKASALLGLPSSPKFASATSSGKSFSFIPAFMRPPKHKRAQSTAQASGPSAVAVGTAEEPPASAASSAASINKAALVEPIPSIDLTRLQSAILTDNTHAAVLTRYLPGVDWSRARLLYRASRDGFEAADYWRQCEGQANTLTLVKVAESGNVIAAFTPVAWPADAGGKSHVFGTSLADASDRTRLVSLVNQHGRACRLRLKVDQQAAALKLFAGTGPGFGNGDLRLFTRDREARDRDGCYCYPDSFELDQEAERDAGLPPIPFQYNKVLLSGARSHFRKPYADFGAEEVECYTL